VTGRSAFEPVRPRMRRSGAVAVRVRCHGEPLACKSWADGVPQYARDVLPRRIFGCDVAPSADVLGSLLHNFYMVRLSQRLLARAERGDGQPIPARCADQNSGTASLASKAVSGGPAASATCWCVSMRVWCSACRSMSLLSDPAVKIEWIDQC
jgi:hypothetical protein